MHVYTTCCCAAMGTLAWPACGPSCRASRCGRRLLRWCSRRNGKKRRQPLQPWQPQQPLQQLLRRRPLVAALKGHLLQAQPPR
jgi:hypothetical protein